MKYTAEDFANQIGEFRRKMAGMVRRMVVKLSDGGVWQVAGHLLFEGQREAPPAENYPGIGFAARPPAGTSAEAIVVQVGGANQPAIVGLRDEATRAKVSAIVADEAVVYNSVARVYVKADGTIEIRSHAGAAVLLATKQDLIDLRTKLLSWVPVAGDGGAALKTILTAWLGAGPVFPWPVGTSKLKGE